MSQSGFFDNTSIAGDIEKIVGNVGGAVGPNALFTVSLLGTDPITVTGNPAAHTLTITVADATITQKGVLELATDAETIAGTATSVAVVPSSLAAKLGVLTAHGVLLGEGTTNALSATAVGTDGQVLLAATGADPAFGTTSYSDFTFSNLTPATPRTLAVTNGDGDPASSANLLIGLSAGAGDPSVNWQISATQNYAAGIDNSVAGDPWKLTNSTDPSSGDAIISSTSAGVITLFNDLDVSEGGTGVSTLTSHGILMGNGAGDINATAEPSNGQLLMGSTGNFPVLATLTAGTGIGITNAAGSITVNAVGGGVSWSVVTVDTSFAVNTGVIANKAGLLTVTLPATAAIGDILEITGINTAVGWRIAQNANQRIHFAGLSTTVGAGGYIEATAIRDSVKMVCVIAGASTEWNVISSCGASITVV